jgi:hypothetical protein
MTAEDQEVVGQHDQADEELEALLAFEPAALHPATAGQHADAPFDAGPKLLSPFEAAALLVRRALWSFRPAACQRRELCATPLFKRDA